YIIGDNRSGSTLLDYLLSSHPDAVSVGELHHFYGHYYKKGIGKSWGWKCSCNEELKYCNFWSKILKNIPFNSKFLTTMNDAQFGILKEIEFFACTKKKMENDYIAESGKQMADNRWEIYKAVASETKKNIIIDSSKNAYQAYFLNKHKQGRICF